MARALWRITKNGLKFGRIDGGASDVARVFSATNPRVSAVPCFAKRFAIGLCGKDLIRIRPFLGRLHFLGSDIALAALVLPEYRLK